MAIASLVLGIVSIVCAFFTKWAWIGIIVGVVGIVLAAMARKKEGEPKGVATGGLVTSIVGAALSLVLFLTCGLLCIAAEKGSETMLKEMSKDPKALEKSLDQLKKLSEDLEKQ
jgi:lysylphosphatidylglycerol synthetase-like protein (DUF2156 family)